VVHKSQMWDVIGLKCLSTMEICLPEI
jgi:hypothetical protein